MNNSFNEDFKNDGLISNLVRRISELERFEREFRLKKFGTGGGGGGGDKYPCEGRITLESGVAVSTSDQSAKTTLYFTLHIGNQIALYNGVAWQTLLFSELSISNAGLSASKPYDVFIYNNAGTATLELLVWINDTTRATALTLQDGVLVKSGDTTRRYVGTVYTDAASKFNDTVSLRNTWNYYNREVRILNARETTNSWTYATANTWREVRTGTGGVGLSRVNYVIGWQDAFVNLRAYHCGGPAGAGAPWMMTGIGIDATNANSAQILRGDYGFFGAGLATCIAEYKAYQSVGLHYAAWLERQDSAATVNWFGNINSANNGVLGEVMG